MRAIAVRLCSGRANRRAPTPQHVFLRESVADLGFEQVLVATCKCLPTRVPIMLEVSTESRDC